MPRSNKQIQSSPKVHDIQANAFKRANFLSDSVKFAIWCFMLFPVAAIITYFYYSALLDRKPDSFYIPLSAENHIPSFKAITATKPMYSDEEVIRFVERAIQECFNLSKANLSVELSQCSNSYLTSSGSLQFNGALFDIGIDRLIKSKDILTWYQFDKSKNPIQIINQERVGSKWIWDISVKGELMFESPKTTTSRDWGLKIKVTRLFPLGYEESIRISIFTPI